MTTTKTKAMLMTDDTLTQITSEVAPTRFRRVSAEFCQFRDFKVQWSKSYDCIHFRVSDYLALAPKYVVKGVIQTLFRKLDVAEECRYPSETGYWLLNELSGIGQQMYIKRNKLREGAYQDLDELAGRVDAKVAKNIDAKVVFGSRTGMSVLFKVIAISEDYDVPGAETLLVKLITEQYERLVNGVKEFKQQIQ